MMTRGTKGTCSKYDRFYAYDQTPTRVVLDDFSAGISTKSAKTHALSGVLNMEPVGKTLVSLPAVEEEVTEGGFSEGEVTSHCYADGVWLFRKGRTLYARIGETISIVGTEDMLTMETGHIYDTEGTFFVVDGMDVWAVGRDLSVRKLEQEIPIYAVNVERDGVGFDQDTGANPYTPYVDIVLSNETAYTQYLPNFIAYDPNDITIFLAGTSEEMSSENYAFGADFILFLDVHPGRCRLRLKLIDSDDTSKLSLRNLSQLRDFLETPNKLYAYTDAAGNAYFLTWQDREVVLIRREEDMFSHFSDQLTTRFSMGETVTAVIPYADGYFVFAENIVKKLYFSMDESGVLSAKTEIFKQDFGSDMPGSVCAFDDKILFASSRGGIFYVNKFGITERDASRKISENIEEGALGFFSHTEEEYRAAKGVCAFGRYFLTVGTSTYIWDYAKKLPTSTLSLSDEEAMVWTVSDRFDGMHFLQNLVGRLYLWDTKTQTLRFFEGEHGAESGGESSFVTSSFDFNQAGEKVLTEIGIRYRSASALSVSLIFDGEASSAVYTLPAQEVSKTVKIFPYAKKFEKISVSVSSPSFSAVEAILFNYI